MYGDVDDKFFHEEKLTEIEEWLEDGEALTDQDTIESLADEWREYDEENGEGNE